MLPCPSVLENSVESFALAPIQLRQYIGRRRFSLQNRFRADVESPGAQIHQTAGETDALASAEILDTQDPVREAAGRKPSMSKTLRSELLRARFHSHSTSSPYAPTLVSLREDWGTRAPTSRSGARYHLTIAGADVEQLTA
jgi:hypothetical protein